MSVVVMPRDDPLRSRIATPRRRRRHGFSPRAGCRLQSLRETAGAPHRLNSTDEWVADQGVPDCVLTRIPRVLCSIGTDTSALPYLHITAQMGELASDHPQQGVAFTCVDVLGRGRSPPSRRAPWPLVSRWPLPRARSSWSRPRRPSPPRDQARAADLGRRAAPVRPRMVRRQPSRLGAGEARRRRRRVRTAHTPVPSDSDPGMTGPGDRRQPADDRRLLRRRVQPRAAAGGDDLVPRPADRRRSHLRLAGRHRPRPRSTPARASPGLPGSILK